MYATTILISNFLNLGINFRKSVNFIDFQAAVLANVSPVPSDCIYVETIKVLLSEVVTSGFIILLPWISNYCSTYGNKKADLLINNDS